MQCISGPGHFSSSHGDQFRFKISVVSKNYSVPVYFVLCACQCSARCILFYFMFHIQMKFRGRVSNRDILGTFLHNSFLCEIK